MMQVVIYNENIHQMKSLISLLTCVVVSLSCASYYKAPVPLRMVYYQEARSPGHDTLIVFLPGYLSSPEDFGKENFIISLNKFYPETDSVAVDAGLGYYLKKMLPERLLEDVIKPARRKGYRTIWLAGISLGGSGALWYMTKYPDTIQGILLLSPSLGDAQVISEIETAGGLKAWEPKLPLQVDDYQRAQWLWLKRYLNTKGIRPALALGFGNKDRFYREDMLLARNLPPDQAFLVEGDHNWETWKSIFVKILASGILAK